MVNYDDEPLFHVDSVDKQILMVSDEGGHIRITNDDIIGESFELTESLCSEENLRLNSVESSQIKFRVKNTFPNLYRVWFTVTITMDGAEEPFLLGKYKVWKDKVSSDRSTREITAYDGLYKILTNTYKKWYNEFWSSRTTATMKQFRDAYFTRLQVSHPWISQQSVTLVNDGVILKKSTKIKKISGKDILGTICELNGVCGRIGRDNKFHYIEINKPATVYTIDNSLNIVDDYEDYNTTTIDRVEILSQSGDVLGASGEEQDEAENTYTIENGFLLKGLGNDDDARIKAVSMAQGILTKINNAGYIPFEGEFKGNPCYEVGDRIRFTAHGNTVETLILNRTMRGVQSLHDVYSATGDDTYPDNTNTYSSKTKEIDHKLGDLDSEVGDINTKLENAPTFEVNPDGTVSVSTNNNNEGSYIRTFRMIMYHPFHDWPEVPAPYYQIWEVTVHSTSGVVLCFSPTYIGGEHRSYVLDGKTYYDTTVDIVTTSENSYITQKWVEGVPRSAGAWNPYGGTGEADSIIYLSHYTGYGTVSDSPYYDLANGGGTLIYDTYSGTASTDRSFVSRNGDYSGTFYYAMVNELVEVPGTGGRDVKTLPTATDGYDLANSADSLAKATQGQTYERETPGFTGQINVMPTESIQTVTKSLDVVRENLPEANPTGEATATATTLKLNGTIYNLGGGGGASALSELTDVELTDLADGEILKYDATEDKWVNAEDGGSGGGSVVALPTLYSTKEKMVGLWTDNRPLYQKTIDFGALPNATTKSVAHGISNPDYISFVSAVGKNSSNAFAPIPMTNTLALNQQVQIYFDTTNINIRTAVDYSAWSVCKVTIQYTKTTDTPVEDFNLQDFGIFAPVIYSLEEREIGVWTDGKPLYQKTIIGTSSANFTTAAIIADTGNDTVIREFDGLIDGKRVLNGYSGADDTYTWVTTDLHRLGNYAKGACANKQTIVTVRYTKTTDVSGSGSYAELGIPAVHYDDTERVIGTWFGETLYQKTIFIHNTSLVYSQTYSFATDVPNVDIVIDKESLIKLAGSSWVTGDAYTNTTQYRWDIQVNSASKEVGIQCLGWGFTDAYVTLKYTKTS